MVLCSQMPGPLLTVSAGVGCVTSEQEKVQMSITLSTTLRPAWGTHRVNLPILAKAIHFTWM